MSFAYRWEPPFEGVQQVALVLHGTGGDEHSLVPFAESLLPGAAILSPRGRILERGAPRFFRRFGEGVFDYESIREEAQALADFVGEQRSEKHFASEDVVAVGYSNGANIAAATLLLRPETWTTGVLFRPMMTLTPFGTNPETALAQNPDLQGKRILLAAGERDPIVPLASVQALVKQLQEAGASVELKVRAAGHELSRAEIEDARAWLGWT